MSAPLVINLSDGSVWERRAVTGEGVALYALAGSCKCPEFVMATESELAALGIAGSADVLPMPVGPVLRSELDQARDDVVGACLARWESEQENERLRWALASAKRGRSRLRAEVAALRANAGLALPWAASMDDGDLHGFLDDMVSAAMGRWRSDPEVPDRTVLADIEKACADWRTPGEGFRSDADEEAAPALSERPVNEPTAAYMPVASLREVDVTPQVEKLRSLLAGQRAVLEDPHDSPLHQTYRLSHDLPEAGGR
jgi:hypothetical protein